ncbi:hypothetical protein LINPERPRIM_LOCUS2450 [Linum perenne]
MSSVCLLPRPVKRIKQWRQKQTWCASTRQSRPVW